MLPGIIMVGSVWILGERGLKATIPVRKRKYYPDTSYASDEHGTID